MLCVCAAPCKRDREIAHRVQPSEWSGPNPPRSCVPIGPSDVQDQHCLTMGAARPLPYLLSNFCRCPMCPGSRMSGILLSIFVHLYPSLSNSHYFATRSSSTLPSTFSSTLSSIVLTARQMMESRQTAFFDRTSQRVCHNSQPRPRIYKNLHAH